MKFLPLVLPLALLASAVQAEVTPKVVKTEAKAFDRADKDGDEKISYDEFKALLKALPTALKKFPVTGRGDDPAELLELCEGVFDYFDANTDGFVDFDEWLGARQEYDLGDIADLLAELPGLDRNRNGSVLVTEFLPLMKCFIPASHAKKIYRRILSDYVAVHGHTLGGTLSMGGGATYSGVTVGTAADYWLQYQGALSSGDPQTGTPSNAGSGTTTGTSAGVDAAVVRTWDSGSSGVSESWTRADLDAAVTWINQQSAEEASGSEASGTTELPPEMVAYLRQLLEAAPRNSDTRRWLFELELWKASQSGQ